MECDGCATTGALPPVARPVVNLDFLASQRLDRIVRSVVARLLCSASQTNAPHRVRLPQKQEGTMTLTILDPRSGQTVTIQFADIPAVRQIAPAKVIPHPRAPAPRQ
jgi:hypothetical protein